MSILRTLLWPLRQRSPVSAIPKEGSDLTPAEYARLTPVRQVREGDREAAYYTPNRYTEWRVATFFEKEPDTLGWIAGFGPDEVLLDIGANVGMYTIWAARTRGVRVFAFEPESQNFALLYRNIVLNDVHDRVTAYCAALSDEQRFSLLYLSDFRVGGSLHTFGASLDHNLGPRAAGIAQGCIATTVDRLIADDVMPVPQHVKIDVDGLEHRVLAGCRTTLRNPLVKSLLVEINTNIAEHRSLVDELSGLGFAYSPEQVQQSLRKEGAFTGVGNHVFRR
jgi:FkbM family methyltransferase